MIKYPSNHVEVQKNGWPSSYMMEVRSRDVFICFSGYGIHWKIFIPKDFINSNPIQAAVLTNIKTCIRDKGSVRVLFPSKTLSPSHSALTCFPI